MLKRRERAVLFELVKNGRATDRAVAKKLNTTQPTVTRIRQKLEREGYIEKYMAISRLRKSNLNIVVATLFRWQDFSNVDAVLSFNKYVLGKPQVISYSRGEGVDGRTHMVLSAHESFGDYERFVEDLRHNAGRNMSKLVQFISSVDNIFKRFDTGTSVINALSGGDETKEI